MKRKAGLSTTMRRYVNEKPGSWKIRREIDSTSLGKSTYKNSLPQGKTFQTLISQTIRKALGCFPSFKKRTPSFLQLPEYYYVLTQTCFETGALWLRDIQCLLKLTSHVLFLMHLDCSQHIPLFSSEPHLWSSRLQYALSSKNCNPV